MAPTAVSSPTMPLTTPSKTVAASLEKFALVTPVKAPSFAPKDKHNPDADEQDANDTSSEQVDPSRLRFVGDVDLDEKDEPLLKESQRRFVLFPIQYHEVRRVLSLPDATFTHFSSSFARFG
jgi:ribonucleoside-diphosphate reductase subunit M2